MQCAPVREFAGLQHALACICLHCVVSSAACGLGSVTESGVAFCAQVGSTGVTMRSQKEITLKNDLDAKDRTDIYRNFLLYCMSGDVVALPMGSTGKRKI